MAKFSDTIILRDAVSVRNEEGVVTTQNVDSAPIFFNRYRVSLASRMAGASEGLRRIAEGQIRTIEYGGQEHAVLDGIEYTIEDANNQGEFTVLTLSRRLANG